MSCFLPAGKPSEDCIVEPGTPLGLLIGALLMPRPSIPALRITALVLIIVYLVSGPAPKAAAENL